MKHYENETQKLLRQLGINGSYIGFRYTVFGITETIQNPDLIVYLCKGLYTEIAIHFHVSPSNVERNIRTVVNIIWNHGDRELLNSVFGKNLTEKPRNGIFIDALSQYIVNNCCDE